MRLFLLLLCLVLPSLGSSDLFNSVNYCLDELLPQTEFEPKLHFSKELKTKVYSRARKLVSIHCCASSDRRTIQWFKGETPQPWSGDQSTFIQYPEAGNQTLYTMHVREADGGNYTCEVRSDSAFIRHTIELIIIGEEDIDNTEVTFKPGDVSHGLLSKSVRLYCHAFVGSAGLPDTGRASWQKAEGKPISLPRFNETVIRDESNMEVGAYLIINKLQPEDLGEYQCTITGSGNQKIVLKTRLEEWASPSTQPMTDEFRVAGRYLTLSLFSLGLLVIFYFIRSYFKNFFHIPLHEKGTSGNLETVKKLKLFLIHHEADAYFSRDILHPVLKKNYNLIDGLLTGKELPSDAVQGLGDVPMMLVLSKNVTPDWTRLHVISTIQSIINSEQHVIIFLDPLPDGDPEDAFDFEALMKPYKVVFYTQKEDLNTFPAILEQSFRQTDSAPKQLVVKAEKGSRISPEVNV